MPNISEIKCPDSMPPSVNLNLPLVIAVSTRALFELEEEHNVFDKQGVDAYAALQRERESVVLEPGAAFEVVKRLLSLKSPTGSTLVDVIILSRNSPDLSLRAFYSARQHQLKVERGSFTSGRSLAPFAAAWGADLFLSNNEEDVRAAISAGTAAAKLGPSPASRSEDLPEEVRIALDGDAVVFGDDSESIYQEQGLAAFLEHERQNALVPMKRGPFGNFLLKLAMVRDATRRDDGSSLVRVAIVTARNAPAHERVIHTLRSWGAPADEAHFVGSHPKGPILKAFAAHIFFDDQEKHILSAAPVVPAGHVPGKIRTSLPTAGAELATVADE